MPASSSRSTTSVRPSRTAKNNGVKPGLERRAKVRPGLDQRIDDRDMTIGRRPHQSRLTLPLLGVHVGACSEQRLDRSELARACRRHQGRFAAAQRRVRIGSRFKQQFDDRRVSVLAGERKRRDTVAILGLDVGTGSNNQLRRLRSRRGRRPSGARSSRRLAARSRRRLARARSRAAAASFCLTASASGDSDSAADVPVTSKTLNSTVKIVTSRAICPNCPSLDPESCILQSPSRSVVPSRVAGSPTRQEVQTVRPPGPGCRRTTHAGLRLCSAASGAGWPAALACRT